MGNIIETKNISFEYSDDNGNVEQVLDNISLSIEEGQFVAIIGHNGSGKSTLAKHFNGIHLPTKGQVYVAGMSTADEQSIIKIRQTVGMVFQNPDNQIVATVVEEDVAFGPENLGFKSEEIRRRVDEALQTVGLSEYKNHASYKLSGGQKQRLAIAGIIAMSPKCIVLDEPTAMLDPMGRKEVISTIKKLNREKGMTVILITHYMNEIIDADRIIVMENGRINLDGTPKEIFSHFDTLKDIGLEVPSTTALLHMLSRENIEVDTNILTVKDCVEELTKLLQGVKN